MGGLIGGLYSLGYTVHEMDSIVRNMDWAWALSDKLSRDYITYTDMKYKEKYLLSIPFYYERDYFRMKVADENRFDNVKQHEILHIGADNEEGADFLKHNLLGSLPSGYLYGQNVNNMISSLTVGYQDSIDFQTLPIPYVCVAADMVTGKTKIWHSGRLNDAMRSTMSIPGVFAPVKTGGMVLVDGGIRDNFPTGLAKEMGADIIIGVDLAQGRKGYLDVNNIADIAAQTGVNILELLTNRGKAGAIEALITEDQAARIALEHANVTAEQVTGLRVSYDVDDGVPEYEVEFHHDHWEYEYEIHAETGDIRSYDRDD